MKNQSFFSWLPGLSRLRSSADRRDPATQSSTTFKSLHNRHNLFYYLGSELKDTPGNVLATCLHLCFNMDVFLADDYSGQAFSVTARNCIETLSSAIPALRPNTCSSFSECAVNVGLLKGLDRNSLSLTDWLAFGLMDLKLCRQCHLGTISDSVLFISVSFFLKGMNCFFLFFFSVSIVNSV